MKWWDGLTARRRQGAAAAPPSLTTVHEVMLAVQADVRRLGGAVVRTEAQAKSAAERIAATGTQLQEGMERLRRQQAEAAAAAGRLAEERARLLVPFLDLGDSLARALRAAAGPLRSPVGGEGEAPAAGPVAAERLEQVQTLSRLAEQWERLLADAGVRALAAEGMPFDPRLHRAIGSVERAGAAGHVVLVDRQGYRLDNALLRPAEVWVAVAPVQGAASDERGMP